MTAIAIITALCLIGVIWLLIKGHRAAKKPLTLKELDFRVQSAILTGLNAANLKKSIDEMREQLIYKRYNCKIESLRLVIECDLKRLESIERTFEFKFVEFLPGAKVKYPDMEVTFANGVKYNIPISESDRSENKRGFQNRSDMDEVDHSFMSHIQG